MHQHLDAIKAAGGFAFGIISWAGGKLAQITDIPDIVKAADTPLIVGGLSYGVFHLWRELKASNTARIADQQKFIETLRSDAEKAATSRETLVRATTEQTTTLHQQTAAIEALRRTVEENRHRPLLQERNDK